jgi:hypothetical protein
MAETTSKTAAQKEAEADLGKTELTPAEKKKREASHETAPPAPEAAPAIGSVNASYIDQHGNWSDPPELVDGEIEVEGSLAKPKQEDLDETNAEIREKEKEQIAKAIEENTKKADDLAQYDAEQKKKVAS